MARLFLAAALLALAAQAALGSPLGLRSRKLLQATSSNAANGFGNGVFGQTAGGTGLGGPLFQLGNLQTVAQGGSSQARGAHWAEGHAPASKVLGPCSALQQL